MFLWNRKLKQIHLAINIIGIKEWIWGGSSDFTEVDGLYKGQYDGPDPTTVIEANKINKIKLFV